MVEYCIARRKKYEAMSDEELMKNVERDFFALDEAIRREPENPIYCYQRGSKYHDTTRLPQAIENYTRAIELDPEGLYERLSYGMRSLCLEEQGKFTESADDRLKEITLNPSPCEFDYQLIAEIMYSAGRYEDAVAYMKKVSDEYRRWYIYADSLFHINEYEEAEFAINQAMEHYPNGDDCHESAMMIKYGWIEDRFLNTPEIKDHYRLRAKIRRSLGLLKEAEADMAEVERLEENTENLSRIAEECIRTLKENTSKKSAFLNVSESKTGLTDSKLGGIPFIPAGGKYPVLNKKGEKPYFFAQINFADMPRIPDFPEKGILQIFIKASKASEGIFHFGKKKNDITVLWHEEISAPMAEEEVLALMPELPLDECLPLFMELGEEYQITFEEKEMPIMIHNSGFDEKYDEYCANLLPKEWNHSYWMPYEFMNKFVLELYRSGSRVGGYLPGFIAPNPDNINLLGNDDIRTFIPDKEIHPGSELLLQIESIVKQGYRSKFLWMKLEYLQFFIDPEDLKNRDFSKVYHHIHTIE